MLALRVPAARKARITLCERLGETSMLEQRGPNPRSLMMARGLYRRTRRTVPTHSTNTPGMDAQDPGARRTPLFGPRAASSVVTDDAQACSMTRA